MKPIKSALCLLIISVCLSQLASAQTINTIAGNDTLEYSGDGGAAISAGIGQPMNVATDAIGNFYISDIASSVIRKVNTSGIISTYAGNRTRGYSGDDSAATSASLYAPTGIVCDFYGNLYIADVRDNVIRKVTPSGIINTFAGTGIAGYAGDSGLAKMAKLNRPYGMAIDAFGNIYIADAGNNVIRKVDTAGIISTFAGTRAEGYSGDGGVAVAAKLHDPVAIVFDAANNLYIVDASNNVVRKVNAAGIISTFAGTGAIGYAGDGGPAVDALFNRLLGITIDHTGNLYVTDNGNDLIRKINTSGIISTYAGNGIIGNSGNGGPATSAEFDYPVGLAVDDADRLLIAVARNFNVRVVSNPTAIEPLMNTTNAPKVYPNPVNDELNITGVRQNTSYRLLNVTGQCLWHGDLKPGSNTLFMQTFSPDVYILEMTGMDGERSMVRVVKE